MKVGRNSPCPCGSGEKFKRCCLVKPGPAQAVADEISEAATEQPFESPEELNAFVAQRMRQRNQTGLDEFCGLSPEQMYHLLRLPFESPETVTFNTDCESVHNTEIMRLFMPMVEAIGDSGLKTTAKGNLPLKFCKAMAEQLKQEYDGTRLLHLGGNQ